MFLAENPTFKKMSNTMEPNDLFMRNELHSFPELYSGSQSQAGLAQTFDLGPQKKLLNRERQFSQLASEFAKGVDYPYENFSQDPSQVYASTMDTKKVGTRGVAVVRKPTSDRKGAWDPKTLQKGVTYDDDLNDRETVVDYGEPAAGVRTALLQVQQQVPFRQAMSVRPAPSNSHFVNSAKMQIGNHPQGSLHNTVGLPENPLLGISEGERQRKLYKEEFMKYALSGAEGSINDVKERSRSKSRRARYEASKQQQAAEESFVDIMNRTKQQYQPNRLAMKQRYTYSPKGMVARAGSADLIRSASDERNSNGQPYQNRNLNEQASQNFRSFNTIGQQQSMPKVIDIGGAQTAPDMLEREQKKAEYRAILFSQMNEKNEKKRQTKAKETEDEARLMNEYAMHYRIGALKQGGGSPIRDRNGDVVTQHQPFTSQVLHNGGVEERGDVSNIYDNRQQDPTTSYGQQFGTSFRAQDYSLKVIAGSTYSPKKQEIMHMKPSNMFEDITEEEFNKREQEKKSYQHELMSQMREAKEKKQMEKERIQRQEIEDEMKIHAALNQMREAYKKEENKGNYREEQAASAQSQYQHLPRSILKERSQSNSRLQVHKPPSSNHNVSMTMPMSSPDGYDQMNINVEPDYYQQPYRQRPLSNVGTSNLGTHHGSGVHDEQMERLRRVQQEIEIKTTQDRIETEKIFRDLVDSNKKLSNMIQQSSPYSLRNFPQPKIKMSLEPSKFDTQAMSGNIRLESQYLRLISNPPQPKFNSNFGAENGPYEGRLTPNRQSESLTPDKVLGGPSANLAVARDSYKESAIGKLDDLIGDFQKNN